MTDFKKWFAARARNPDRITLEEAFNAGYAQPAPSESSIAAGVLSGMFLSLDGHDKAQPGYEWRKGWNDALRQAMDYAQPAPFIPEGWKLVPIEPTFEMLDKGLDQSFGYVGVAREVWAAMLAAAPEAKP